MKIVVLEYYLGEVIIKDVPKDIQDLDGDDILTEMGFNQSATEYMIVEDDLSLTIDTQGCNSKMTLK
jgi:glycyl-tRNA synthetase alpha subunit